MTFRVGMKVACIHDGSDDPRLWAADPLVIGAVYTIVRTFVDFDPLIHDNILMLELGEIKNSETWQYGYAAEHFRPLVSRKTDISIFRAMLNPSRQGVGA